MTSEETGHHRFDRNIIGLSFRPWLPAMLAAWAWEIGVGPVFPRVTVETPAPPVLGKETLAGPLPVCVSLP
jgi:hypothetical protein